MLEEKLKITPFRSDEQANGWITRNCNSCIFAHQPKRPTQYRIEQMERLASKGMECKLRCGIVRGLIGDGIDTETAEKVGMESKYCPTYCKKFMPKNKVGKPKKRNRVLHFFGLN